MHEVSMLALRTIIGMAGRAGLSQAELVSGLGIEASPARVLRRVSWDAYATVIERCELAAGGPEAWEAMVDRHLHVSVAPELAWVTRGLVRPRTLYRVVFGVVGPLLFPVLDLTVRDVPPSCLRIVSRLRPGARPCLAFFRGCAAGVPGTVRHLGLPPARSDLEELDERGAVALVHLPPGSARKQSAGPARLPPARVGRRLLLQLGEELRASDHGATAVQARLASVSALGHELAEAADLESLADALVTMLARLGWDRVALWVGPETTTSGARPFREQGPARAGLELGLQVGGERVGTLAVAGAGDETLMHDLVPWLAMAVQRAAGRSFEHRLEAARRRLDLTPRQREILAYVVRGSSNKEIARALGCAENTIEFHMTQLLRKTASDGRTALIAHFWDGSLT